MSFNFLRFQSFILYSQLVAYLILQLGSLLSIYGCRKYQNRVGRETVTRLDAERGTYVAPILDEN
ncbi:hypothetical protein OFM39_29800, partial [Escherichia coli]|nr:hypothetical protein [Escherichia coli]